MLTIHGIYRYLLLYSSVSGDQYLHTSNLSNIPNNPLLVQFDQSMTPLAQSVKYYANQEYMSTLTAPASQLGIYPSNPWHPSAPDMYSSVSGDQYLHTSNLSNFPTNPPLVQFDPSLAPLAHSVTYDTNPAYMSTDPSTVTAPASKLGIYPSNPWHSPAPAMYSSVSGDQYLHTSNLSNFPTHLPLAQYGPNAAPLTHPLRYTNQTYRSADHFTLTVPASQPGIHALSPMLPPVLPVMNSSVSDNQYHHASNSPTRYQRHSSTTNPTQQFYQQFHSNR